MEQDALVAYGCLQCIASELPIAMGLKSRYELSIADWDRIKDQEHHSFNDAVPTSWEI